MKDWTLRIPSLDRKPNHGSRRHKDESIVRRICTHCLQGFVQEDQDYCGCGAELRELSQTMKAKEFHRLDAEQKQDLQTRRIS